MANKIRVIGGKEIEKALRKKLAEAQEALEQVAQAAADPVREAAAEKAPELTGELSRRIIQETTDKEKNQVVVSVGPDDEVDWYGLFVEFGTPPHTVKRDRARGLQVDEDGFAASMEHPGARAQPYLRPALDGETDAATAAAGKELKKALKL